MLSWPLWMACITSLMVYLGFLAAAMATGAQANAAKSATAQKFVVMVRRAWGFIDRRISSGRRDAVQFENVRCGVAGARFLGVKARTLTQRTQNSQTVSTGIYAS